MNYFNYINSKEWKEKSKLFAAKNCEFCHSIQFLQTHHRNYETLGKELPEDLITLCGNCHKNIHFTYQNGKIKRWQSGSELYYLASKQSWKVKGWKKQKKVNQYLLRVRMGNKPELTASSDPAKHRLISM